MQQSLKSLCDPSNRSFVYVIIVPSLKFKNVILQCAPNEFNLHLEQLNQHYTPCSDFMTVAEVQRDHLGPEHGNLFPRRVRDQGNWGRILYHGSQA